MPKFRKEYYFNEDSYRIPLDKLNITTYNKVKMLGDFLHIDWDDEATVTPQPGTSTPGWSQEEVDTYIAEMPTIQARINSFMKWHPGEDPSDSKIITLKDFEDDYKMDLRFARRLGKPTQPVKTFIIEGVGPDGEEVVYVRRETGHSIGGTNLYIDGNRFQVSRLIARAKGETLRHPGTAPTEFDPFSDLDAIKEDWG